MSRRSIRKQQIEAVHDLLERPAFVVYPAGQRAEWTGLRNRMVDMYRVTDNPRRVSPLDMSAELPTNATSFNYVTSDQDHAKFVCRSKNAEAITDAVRELSK